MPTEAGGGATRARHALLSRGLLAQLQTISSQLQTRVLQAGPSCRHASWHSLMCTAVKGSAATEVLCGMRRGVAGHDGYRRAAALPRAGVATLRSASTAHLTCHFAVDPVYVC